MRDCLDHGDRLECLWVTVQMALIDVSHSWVCVRMCKNDHTHTEQSTSKQGSEHSAHLLVFSTLDCGSDVTTSCRGGLKPGTVS